MFLSCNSLGVFQQGETGERLPLSGNDEPARLEPDGTVSQVFFAELSGVFAELSEVFAELSEVFAELSEVFAELSGVFAELSGVFAELSGVFAELSGVFAELQEVFAELSGVFALGDANHSPKGGAVGSFLDVTF